MNMLSSLPPAEAVDGGWNAFIILLFWFVSFIKDFKKYKVVFFFVSCSKWEVAPTASQSRE